MLPGPNNIIRCPHCDKLYVQPSLLSGNTYGGVSFSDGSAYYPMLPEFPLITRCSDCQHIFWVEDAAVVGSYDWGEEICDDWQKTEDIQFLSIEENVSVLEQKKYNNKEEEIYIRRHIWWKLNGIKRTQQLSITQGSLYDENAKRLLELFNPKISKELIFIAELYRNIGLFDESRKMINLMDDKTYTDIKRKFLIQINNKNTDTFQL